jgi:DNA repair protein SbcC/Rad50
VVLPQGQFAQLLVGDDPTVRATILRQVWRTDELTKAGQLADEALPALSQFVGQVTQALDGMPENPEAHLQLLRADAERRVDLAKRAHDTHRAATTARDTLAQADERTEAAASVIAKIGDFDFGEAAATAEEVVRSASVIATERATVEKDQEIQREQLQTVPSDDDGLDYQAIGAARVILDQLSSRAETALNAAERARTDAVDAEDAERHATELDEELQELNHRLDQREDARRDLDTARADVETKLNDAQNLLSDARQAAAEAERLRGQASQKAYQAELLRQQMIRLQEDDLVRAEQSATAAETAYADARRQNAAAAAADGLHSGDDCSVCNRPLPQDWTPPAAEDLNTARSTQEATQAVLTEVRSKIRGLATRAEVTDNQATELQQDGDRWLETERTAAAGLARLIGRDEINLATIPPGGDLLHPLSDAAHKAREELAAYDSESQQLREQRAAAQNEVANAHVSIKKIRAAHTRDSGEAAEAMQKLRANLA